MYNILWVELKYRLWYTGYGVALYWIKGFRFWSNFHKFKSPLTWRLWWEDYNDMWPKQSWRYMTWMVVWTHFVIETVLTHTQFLIAHNGHVFLKNLKTRFVYSVHLVEEGIVAEERKRLKFINFISKYDFEVLQFLENEH